MVYTTIDELMVRRTLPGQPISKSSISRFQKARPEFYVSKVRSVDIARLSLENQITYIKEYYLLRQKTIKEYNIALADNQNIDEIGICINCVSGGSKVVTITIVIKLPVEVADFLNKKSSTYISGGLAVSKVISVYIIFKTYFSIT